MTVPCMLGFRCPYKEYIQGEPVCQYPYIRIQEMSHPQESFQIADNLSAQDCPLIEPDSDIENMLMEAEQ